MQCIIQWAWIPLLKPNYTSDRHFQSFRQRGGQGCITPNKNGTYLNQHQEKSTPLTVQYLQYESAKQN